MNPRLFLTQSLKTSPHGEAVTRILAAALEAVDPFMAVKKSMKRSQNILTIHDRTYDLDHYEHVFVCGFGKASLPMTKATKEILDKFYTSGIAITKTIPSQEALCLYKQVPGLVVIQAAHPVPDNTSLESTRQVIDLLKTTGENDLVLFLISGGGSALLTSPVFQLKLQDIQSLTRSLLASGANIGEINTLRKHLSQVKGGNLARLAAPAQVVTLILSDVIGDPLDVIASGPTVPDPTTYEDALAIVEKYQLVATLPDSILDHLLRGVRGEIPETPKAEEPFFKKTQNFVIGNNYQAAQAAKLQAIAEGFNAEILTSSLEGEARQVAPYLTSIARQIVDTGDPIPPPACVIAGGETTVTITGEGKGGRNQELALAAVNLLKNRKGLMLITLATDGEDGPTDAAGAVVSGDSYAAACSLGLDPLEFLSRNDSYHFFDLLGDLLKPGPTGTNVCDLSFIFAFY